MGRLDPRGLLLAVCLGACLGAGCRAPATHEPAALASAPAELVAELRAHVEVFAAAGRSLVFPWTLTRAADFIRDEWEAQGYVVESHAYAVGKHEVANLSIRIAGRRPELIVVGAHYDSCQDHPGADDNGSGVAVMLELSRRLRDAVPEYTVEFVAFANEEPPYFRDPEAMGSAVHARALREAGEEVEAMLSIESVGYFSDEPGSQRYPAIVRPLYPDTGNFLAVVGKTRSRPLVRSVVAGLERHGPIPIESIAAPGFIPGIGWSDHWSFWKQGWPMAVMVTDTAVFRNPNYHRPTDRPDTLDYERMAWVVVALEGTIRELAR